MEIKIINEIRDEVKVFKSIEEFNLYYQKSKDVMEKLTIKKERYKIINFLLSNLDSWLPSRLIQQGATFGMSNNRSEGFFGLFKSKYGYLRVTLTQLVANLVDFARLMQVQSERKIAKDQNFYDGFDLLPNKDLPRIGHMALKILSEEYTSFLNKYDNSPFCTWCHLRNSSFHAFALPCRHIMTRNQPQFKLRDFHPRYLRIEVEPPQIPNSIDITPKTSNNNLNSYTNIMATLSPYASVAPRVPEVMSIFNDAIDKLNSTKSNINEGMPPTLAIKGKLPAHPANNVVLAGAPKTKKMYNVLIVMNSDIMKLHARKEKMIKCNYLLYKYL